MNSYYHPFYPSYRSRFNHHFHTQLAAIQHSHMLQQKAQLQYFTHVQRQREAASLVAATYEAQIMERELRLSDLLRRSRYTAQVERQRLYQSAKEEQLYYQSLARQIELNRQLMLSKQRHYYMSERKNNDNLLINTYYIGNAKQYQYEKNSKIKQNEKIRAKSVHIQNQLRKDHSVRIPNNNTGSLQNENNKIANQPNFPINKINEKQREINEKQVTNEKKINGPPQNNEQINSLKNKKPKNVSFKDKIIINNSFTKQPYPQSPLALKPIDLNNNKQFSDKNQNNNSKIISSKTLKQNATKRIKNRFRVSQFVYRDSELRNIKHQHSHLFSTFQTEMMLRKELKMRINNEPKVIEKYKIVVSEK